MIECSTQLTQFIQAISRLARQAHAQLIGTPGVGLFTQAVERDDQQPIQSDAQQQGEQPRNHAIGDHAPEYLVAPWHEPLGQFDHQAADGGVAGKRHP
ncbi:hypothetical protein D3C80_1410450 [compost metagenome]